VPQVLAVWRKKSDEGISLITFGGFSVLQVIGIVHGVYQRDLSLILGMAASFADLRIGDGADDFLSGEAVEGGVGGLRAVVSHPFRSPR